MYLEEHGGPGGDGQLGWGGIGRKFKKAVKKVTKPIEKIVKPIAKPVFKLAAKTNPLVALHLAGAKRGKSIGRAMFPMLELTRKPLSYAARGIVPAAPAASIPQEDYSGSEYTQEERTAFIDGAMPQVEPYASGYPSQEESFGPVVPGSVEPEDLQPEPPAKPKLNLPLLGGVLLLLNFL